MQEIVQIHLQRENNLYTSVSNLTDLFRLVLDVICFRSISFDPTGAPQELNETVSSGLDGWAAEIYEPGESFPASWTTGRRVASTRCSAVTVCPLDHDG